MKDTPGEPAGYSLEDAEFHKEAKSKGYLYLGTGAENCPVRWYRVEKRPIGC